MKTKKPKLTALQVVLGYLLTSREKGATSDEIERASGLPHQTVSARLNELKYQHRMAYTPSRTRLTRRGRPAAVYFVF